MNISRKVSYNFSEGAKAKVLTADLQLNAQSGGEAAPGAFCIQVFFTDLDAASRATVYLALSNDGVNFVRVTGKEFSVSGSGQTTFFIFAGAEYAKAAYAQIGIDTVTVPGAISKIAFGS